MTAEQFSAAYTGGFKSTVRLLCRYGMTIEEAREVAQIAWARGWAARHQWNGHATITSWVGSIAINCRNNLIRASKFWGEMPFDDPTVENQAVDPMLQKAIDKLNVGARSLIIQKYFHDRTCSEIAAREGKSDITVRVNLCRARAHLKELLSAR